MRILAVIQGDQEWVKARATTRKCASDAPAMMGVSKKLLRNELIRMKATGDSKEFSEWVVKNLLNRGHEIEAKARPMIDELLCEEFYPVTAHDDSGQYLASFDGINMAGTIAWECKSWNEALAASVTAGTVPPTHSPQLDHQLLVGDELEKIIFVVTDGTPEKFVWCEYPRDEAAINRLVDAWKQFDQDVADYQPVEVIPAAVAAPVMALPALSIQVTGSIALVDNLKVFGERLEAFIEAIDKSPSDDQAFADAEAAIKTLGTAETALEAAKSSALAQTASIDEMTRTVALYAGQARATRLMLEKMVKSRKDTIRGEIVTGGKNALAEHVAGLNKRLGHPYMPVIASDFPGVVKGKRTIASLRDAVDTELARAKIEANAVADRIQINMKALESISSQHLFTDFSAICTKLPEDFAALAVMRVSAEEKRLNDEREKMRKEEEARAEAKVRAEAASKAEAERREIEEATRKAEAQRAADLVAKDAAIRTQNKVATVGGSQPVDASKEPASGPSKDIESGQISAARSATLPPLKARPSDDQIILAVGEHFGVDRNQALTWIADMQIHQTA